MPWAGSWADAYEVTATVLSTVINTSNALEALKREPHTGNTAPSRCWGTWVLKDKEEITRQIKMQKVSE